MTLCVTMVQSFADLGYGVDVSQADAYTLPGASAGKAVAKITAYQPPALFSMSRGHILPSFTAPTCRGKGGSSVATRRSSEAAAGRVRWR